MNTHKRIIIDPNIRFGKPVIAGTRITVADILGLLAAGYTLADIPKQYPDITEKDVQAAIEFAMDLTDNPAKILHRLATGQAAHA